MWELCSQFICTQYGVKKLGDIPYGQGWVACDKEFDFVLRKITMLGYGLIMIAHAKKRIEAGPDDTTIEIVGPDIQNRAYAIVNRLVDIIGFIDVTWNKDGSSKRVLHTRRTPTVMAGSRFRHLAPTIPFGYSELVDALNTAIDRSQNLDGAEIVTGPVENEPVYSTRPFEEIQAEAKDIWTKLVAKDENNVELILDKVETVFGYRRRLSDITPEQADLFELLILELRDMLK